MQFRLSVSLGRGRLPALYLSAFIKKMASSHVERLVPAASEAAGDATGGEARVESCCG